jgi:D-amino-acid dehydrogenase
VTSPTQIKELDVESGRVRGVITDRVRMSADAVVVALGSHSPLLLKSFGLKLPVYSVKGYSLTIPITDASRAPESTCRTGQSSV